MAEPPTHDRSDPRFLRALFDRATSLSTTHAVSSVFVGIAGREGDRQVGDFIDFVESELRMDDTIFRMLRERAVLLLTDSTPEAAAGVVDRLRADFATRFPTMTELDVGVGVCPLSAGSGASIKDVLPGLFDSAPRGRA